LSIFDVIGQVTATAYHGHKAQKEAARFEANVKPGHTYYSIVINRSPRGTSPSHFLLEWKFSKPGRWIGQPPKCGHLSAAGAWLGFGPLYEVRPKGILTWQEWNDRPDVTDDAGKSYNLVAAGV
jgi:hypothetical protein